MKCDKCKHEWRYIEECHEDISLYHCIYCLAEAETKEVLTAAGIMMDVTIREARG